VHRGEKTIGRMQVLAVVPAFDPVDDVEPGLRPDAEDRELYALTRYPEEVEESELELASGDFAQRLFYGQG